MIKSMVIVAVTYRVSPGGEWSSKEEFRTKSTDLELIYVELMIEEVGVG